MLNCFDDILLGICGTFLGIFCHKRVYRLGLTLPFLKTDGCKTGLISDPITGVNDSGYFNVSIYGTSQPAGNLHSHNTAGSGNLRGSPNRILFNPLSSPINVSNTILKISGGSLNIDGTVNLNSMNT